MKQCATLALFALVPLLTACTPSLWRNQEIQGVHLNSISFPTVDKGWVAGENGVIWHSSDRGSSWTPQASQTNESLLSIFFINDQEGWAVGGRGVVRHTNNGGATWGQQAGNLSPTLFLSSVFFLGTTGRGWITGTERPTAPGGLLPSGPDNAILLRTSNGGVSWSDGLTPATYPSYPLRGQLHDVFFVDADYGWAVGSGGIILHTTDGGSLWGPQTSNTTGELRGVYFLDRSTGVAVGGNDGRSATAGLPSRIILRTENGGRTWSVIEEAEGDPHRRVVFTGATEGWIASGGDYYRRRQVNRTDHTGSILRSQDAGRSWMQTAGGLTQPIWDIWFADVQHGFAVAAYDDGSSTKSRIYRYRP